MFSKKESTNKTSTGWLGLLSYVIQGSKKKFLLALTLSLLANAFVSVANPLSLKYLFDEGVIRGDFTLFVILAVASILIFTLWRVWVYFNRLYVQRLKIEVTKNLCERMVATYYRIPYSEVIKKDQGYYVSRVYDEVNTTAQPTIDAFLSLSASCISLICGVVIVLTMSWRASLAILFALPLIYLVTRKYGGKIKELAKVEKEKEANLKGILTRSVNSFKLANIFGLKEKVLEKIEDTFNTYAAAFTQRFKVGTRYEALNGTLMSYAETLAIIAAGYEMLVGRMSFGGYMAFMTSYWIVIGSIRGLFGLVPEISRLIGGVERLKEFETMQDQVRRISYSDEIVLGKVSFAYESKNILTEVDFKANPGERILIQGPNGIGKSSLAHIISGLLEPQTGDLTTFPLSEVSAIVQPLEFIPGSVKDNISFASTEKQKAVFANLASAFGLEESLDKDPVELSSGQRKKLEIIMGLTKEAKIYIFDEPLSGIDVESKENVMTQIMENTKDKIVIVIMHGDEKFHKYFDRKIEMSPERLVEVSDPAQVLSFVGKAS